MTRSPVSAVASAAAFLTFLFRALSFSTTPSSSDTTESTTGKLLSVFSSSATTIVT